MGFSYNISAMKKEAPLAFRVPPDLKGNLEEIAKREARSVSQICVILLTLGIEAYKKEGTKYLQRFLAQRKLKDSE
ncbi:MAG: hypothetical protein HY313_06275 [Acidobacteria bacterium]|nr:hypothetical protein [Acidobacteriota bacterium]